MHHKVEIPTITTQGKHRREAVELLSHFMRNPGWFSILLGGARGTGKSFWVQKIYAAFQGIEGLEEYQKPLLIKRADQIPADREAIATLFRDAQMGALVIEDIDELPEVPQQRLLLEALVTGDGKLGLGDERDYIRIIFTTSKPISDLKSGENRLLPELWDRISQLVVELPSFAVEKENILQDFNATWGKMQFDILSNMPDLRELKEWLEAESGHFHGNFRDLDKICILWHQYRLIVYGDMAKISAPLEVKVFERVKADFERFSSFPLQQSDESMVFEFEEGHSKTVLEKRFRKKFKTWALKTYGTMQKAAKELDMSPRTMDRW